MASTLALAFVLLLVVVSAAAEVECETYLAPSGVKDAASHGFGLGIFTGVPIKKGKDLVHLGEILLPFYDSSTIDASHPPLREYLWPSVGTLPELALVGGRSRESSFWFGAGISSIAPCTLTGHNLKLSASGWLPGISRRNVAEDDVVPPRTSPSAGSHSYRHSLSYVAVRKITAGEELVVACHDDVFDGDSAIRGSLVRGTYNSSDPTHMCLDKVKTDTSEVVGSRGLFADRAVSEGETIFSSPVAPVHRREMFGDGTGKTAAPGVNSYQLLLNYALGHEESDLLLLPYGPFMNYINHPPPGKKANAAFRWHSARGEDSSSSRRQQYHHPELFRLSAEEVSEIHGKGLVIDVVALDANISVGDEIYVDYGKEWVKAWDDHRKRWNAPSAASTYLSADRWFHSQKDKSILKTAEELKINPYPDNVQTICYYDNDAKVLRKDEGDMVVHTQWRNDEAEDDDNDYIDLEHQPHECMRPCTILDRYPDPDNEGQMLYEADMHHFDDEGNFPFCSLWGRRHIARDLTFDGVLIVDRLYSTDMFLEQAFRHEIGVPSDFFPQEWLRPKVRRRRGASASSLGDTDTGIEFKKKKVGEVVSKKLLMKQLGDERFHHTDL